MNKAGIKQHSAKPLPSLAWWGAGLLLTLLGAAALVYYWRVFYSYGQFPFAHIPAPQLTAVLMGTAVLGWAIAYVLVRRRAGFPVKAAVAVFCAGLLFVFINPPFQAPDEASHYLRAYAISQGRFDFDGSRTYPADVNALMAAFSISWTNAHDGSPIKARTETQMENPTPADTVLGECISNHYVDYTRMLANNEDTLKAYHFTNGVPKQTEPYLFVLLPLFPQAAGIALARLLGFGALGTLYGARTANLLAYALLCYAALKNCRRYRPIFLTVALLPLSLFIAASCSYDGVMMGLYLFAASYYCKDEITDKDMVLFGLAFALMSWLKPNNLLWVVLPFVLPAKAWRARMKKWQAALLVLAMFLALRTGLNLWNTVAIHNYPTVGRVIAGANQLEQIWFMLKNPLRTIAVFWGTLYENDFFLFRLGVFGNTDLVIPVLNTFSAVLLSVGAALSVHEKSSLTKRSALGLFLLAVAYTVSVQAGLYVTYTPVGMARVIGLQARYFLPALLMFFVLLAALLSHVMEFRPAANGEHTERFALRIALGFAVCGALLLFQHYFVGPVTIGYLN